MCYHYKPAADGTKIALRFRAIRKYRLVNMK